MTEYDAMTFTLAKANKNVLERGARVIDQMPSEIYSGSNIGAHFRHTLDAYRSFLRDMNSEDIAPVIDLSNKSRDQRLEFDPDHAYAESLELAGKILRFKGPADQRVFNVRELDERTRLRVPSTLGEMLAILWDHSIHHHGLVREVAKANGYLIEDKAFGVHPSTLSYWKEKRA